MAESGQSDRIPPRFRVDGRDFENAEAVNRYLVSGHTKAELIDLLMVFIAEAAAPPEPPALDVERARNAFEDHANAHRTVEGLHPESCDEWIAAAYGGAAPDRLPSVETEQLIAVSKALIEADNIDMNCGWDSPSCHFCLVDTDRDPHANDCPWAAFKSALASLHEEPTVEQTDG